MQTEISAEMIRKHDMLTLNLQTLLDLEPHCADLLHTATAEQEDHTLPLGIHLPSRKIPCRRQRCPSRSIAISLA